MVVGDDVKRNRHTSCALRASQQRPQQLPHEKHMAGFAVPLGVGELDQPVVVRVDSPSMRAADALWRPGGSGATVWVWVGTGKERGGEGRGCTLCIFFLRVIYSSVYGSECLLLSSRTFLCGDIEERGGDVRGDIEK